MPSPSSANATTSTSTNCATATGFAFIALRDAAVEALLIDDEVRRSSSALARRAVELFKAVLPDPMASPPGHGGGHPRAAERIADAEPRCRRADMTAIADAVDALLDRSIGAEEYVIRAAADGVDPDPLIDLSARSTLTRSRPSSPAVSVLRLSGSRRCSRAGGFCGAA